MDNEVIIDTIKLGSDSTLDVTVSSAPIGSDNGYRFDTMEVAGPGAKYNGYLDGNTVIFDISSAVNNDTMLTLSTNDNVKIDLDKLTLTFTNSITLAKNQIITLIDASNIGGNAAFETSSGLLKDLANPLLQDINGYIFQLKDVGGNLIAELLIVPTTDGPYIIPISNNRGSPSIPNDNPPIVINPIIQGIKIEPHTIDAGTVVLSIHASTTGQETVHSYQWQVQNDDGSWKNIPGGTSATYYYTGLTPGKEYTVRCIVRNATGGETISDPITFIS
jgi:hypothetical protein